MGVIAHHPWVLDVSVDGWVEPLTVDIMCVADDLVKKDAEHWPAVGSQVAGVYQGPMPNGGHRMSLRLSDQKCLPVTWVTARRVTATIDR